MVPVEFDCQWNNHSATETFEIFYGSDCVKVERHMFVNACWSDAAIGGICLVISLVFMFISVCGFELLILYRVLEKYLGHESCPF